METLFNCKSSKKKQQMHTIAALLCNNIFTHFITLQSWRLAENLILPKSKIPKARKINFPKEFGEKQEYKIHIILNI